MRFVLQFNDIISQIIYCCVGSLEIAPSWPGSIFPVIISWTCAWVNSRLCRSLPTFSNSQIYCQYHHLLLPYEHEHCWYRGRLQSEKFLHIRNRNQLSVIVQLLDFVANAIQNVYPPYSWKNLKTRTRHKGNPISVINLFLLSSILLTCWTSFLIQISPKMPKRCNGSQLERENSCSYRKTK